VKVTVEYLQRFLEEDAPFGDITTEAIIPPGTTCRAQIRVKENGVIAGLEEAVMLCSAEGIVATPLVTDGSMVTDGTRVLDLAGRAASVLLVERTVLNLMGRMSGIATGTATCCSLVKAVQSRARITATRKTVPGLRLLDKKAVILGGGEPHRFSLSDAVLIKDNHLALVPIAEAITRARQFSCYKTVEVEAETTAAAVEAARCGADQVLLDNMPVEMVGETLAALEAEGLRKQVLIEVSGGITTGNLQEYARLGIDLISVGGLTHSVRNLDLSLDVLPEKRS
jgi:nicotinate-nucleotide pyrophosphorylase (carboxylating)